jgi:hypothetical protein
LATLSFAERSGVFSVLKLPKLHWLILRLMAEAEDLVLLEVQLRHL